MWDLTGKTKISLLAFSLRSIRAPNPCPPPLNNHPALTLKFSRFNLQHWLVKGKSCLLEIHSQWKCQSINLRISQGCHSVYWQILHHFYLTGKHCFLINEENCTIVITCPQSHDFRSNTDLLNSPQLTLLCVWERSREKKSQKIRIRISIHTVPQGLIRITSASNSNDREKITETKFMYGLIRWDASGSQLNND